MKVKYKDCELCGTEYEKPKHIAYNYFAKRRFCSHKCALTVISPQNGFQKGDNPPKTAYKVGDKRLVKDNNPNWKGGISPEHSRLRNTPEAREWRRKVMERDSFTCQMCGQIGGSLQADHIKAFAYYPELRTDLENGRTLCVSCHEKTPNYKAKAKLL